MTTLVAIVPSVGALFLFWIALRAILQADRRERLAQARLAVAEDRAAAEGDGGGTAAETVSPDGAAAAPAEGGPGGSGRLGDGGPGAG